MKKLIFRTFLAFFGLCTLLSSCRNKDSHEDEQEVITTLRLTFTKTNATGTPIVGVSPIVATWKDADGTGPNAPNVDNIALSANSFYTIELTVLNELANPAQDITAEIRNEGTKHQFFFQKSAGLTSLGNIQYADQDTAGKPIGLTTKIATTAMAGTGTLKIILRHDLNKNGANVSTGDITNAGGETDIETTPAFNLTINI